MTDLSGRRALVVGLGISGMSAARALLDMGAEVKVTEGGSSPAIDARAAELRALGAVVETGGHDLERLDADLAVASPGIPPTSGVLSGLAARGIETISEVELAYGLARCAFIAVTGTNGKTTTTSLIARILEESGVPTAAAGNIGYPLIDAVRALPAEGVVAVEVSSFQLAGTRRFRPSVAVLLNIAEDHTDWHGSFDAYVDAKARITANQTPEDTFLPCLDDPICMGVAERTSARVVPFSASSVPVEGVGISGTDILWRGARVMRADRIRLPGRAGVLDTLAAAGAALEYGIDADAVERGIASFSALRHRSEHVASYGGVDFIDDSKATNPHATLAAVASLEEVVLIAGGRSKGIDLSPLARTVPPVRAVAALGEARDEVAEVFGGIVPCDVVDDMDAAVAAAFARSVPGGSVLLSPGCASLDMYEGYGARGDDFARAVNALIDKERGSSHGDANERVGDRTRS